MVKMGFTGVNVVFLISALSRNMKKYQSFLFEFFQFLEVKFSIYFNRLVLNAISK